jgi:ATPases involved in chromosome partitioning
MAGKGGVGKSVVAALLAIVRKAPLIDLDLFGMAAPKLFGVAGKLHEVGKEGIEPIKVGGVEIFSVGGIVGDRYVVLPGVSQGGVVEALLAFAKLGDAREVVVDMPPGMGEELLSLHRITDFSPIVVTTPSAASYKVVKHLMDYLLELGKRPIAVVVNMAYVRCNGTVIYPFGRGDEVRKLADMHRIPLIEVPVDPQLEEHIGQIYNYRGSVYEVIEKFSKML